MSSLLAVIDIGSNSGRVVVLRVGDEGHLEILADSRAPLRLAREIERDGRLGRESIERTAEALRDFRAIADASGAERTIAVATAAVREASNARSLVERIRTQSGLDVAVISGEEEARLSFLGAVHGLVADSGVVLDLGGGSIELSRFKGRKLVRSWTLALGSLRMSDEFLASDPPRPEEIKALWTHVSGNLTGQGLGTIRQKDKLIGTGGTLRNLAKIDRHHGPYPIPRLHGYVLTRPRVQGIADVLASRRLSRRRTVPGLNLDRADSIVGGTLVALACMDALGADELVVSGQGLREGVAVDALMPEPPPIETVREASVRALVERFSEWEQDRAARRAGIAVKLLEALDPVAGPKSRERMVHAATILDIGTSIDYYRRHEHAADIVTEADLAGFSHRELALLAAVLGSAGGEGVRWQSFRPLLTSADSEPVRRESTLLDLADEIERRLPRGSDTIECVDRRGSVLLSAPLFDPWRQETLARRFRKAFRKKLVIWPEGEGEDG